ncbi:MAG TPA: hypothetical protein PK307_00880 [Spirochaetota bacterium]|nr:hypothetical protein [Spirochaetota bacterium]
MYASAIGSAMSALPPIAALSDRTATCSAPLTIGSMTAVGAAAVAQHD